jgi:hypothetical protein
MSCLAEERFVDLLDRGGLDAASPEEGDHLRACETCRESWATVAAAGELLAEARPRGAGRAIRILPLAAAAAMLLTIVAVIATRHAPSAVTKPLKDPVALFLEGSPEEVRSAREALLKGGRKSLLGLVAARPKLRGSARYQALQDLIWEIKRSGAQEAPDRAILATLENMKIDLKFEDSKIEDLLAFMRDFTRLNLVVDPSLLNIGPIKIVSLKDASLRLTLETLCAVTDLDFDLRYGVIFLSTPMRLWSTDPKVGLPAANGWSNPAREAPLDRATMQKLRSTRITIDSSNSPLSAVAAYMSEISGISTRPAEPIELRLITTKVQDVPMVHVLELITLPFDFDVRLEAGKVVIFDPRK